MDEISFLLPYTMVPLDRKWGRMRPQIDMGDFGGIFVLIRDHWGDGNWTSGGLLVPAGACRGLRGYFDNNFSGEVFFEKSRPMASFGRICGSIGFFIGPIGLGLYFGPFQGNTGSFTPLCEPVPARQIGQTVADVHILTQNYIHPFESAANMGAPLLCREYFQDNWLLFRRDSASIAAPSPAPCFLCVFFS